jgi:hypothetical protein
MSSNLSQIQNLMDDSQLSNKEISRFMEDGFVIVRNVFPRDLAENILLSVMAELKSGMQATSSPESNFVILKKVLYNETTSHVFTEKYIKIVNQLCGKDRWEFDEGIGHFFINYPVSEPEWSPVQNGWHVDNSTDHQSINSQKLGLITFHLLTDILPGGGGTSIRRGSHKYSARILSEAGSEGLKEINFSTRAVLATKRLPFIEITGRAGDVVFMHPLAVHTRSLNISNNIRVIGHKFFHLFEPQNFCGKNSVDHSIVEKSIIGYISQIEK